MALLWICRIDKQVTSQVKDSSETAHQHLSLKEQKRWKILCDASAIVLMVIGIFLFPL